jgi:integrator complex subunit 12
MLRLWNFIKAIIISGIRICLHRGMDVVARNQLVECVECHSLYHQECHQPPVAEADMNDPRSAWYCLNCSKAMSKTVSCICIITFWAGNMLN